MADVYVDTYDDLYGTDDAVAINPVIRQGVKVEIDWDRDGTYSDVTARVRASSSAVSVQYGRDQSTALAPTISGQGNFALDNTSRDYSPRNTASPLYGKIKPARPVKITRTIGTTTHTLFVGHTDDSPINPDLNTRAVNMSLIDFLADLRGSSISTELYRDLRTGDAIHRVLDAAGWPAELRDIDPGSTVVPWWWEDGTVALDAIEKLLRSEGPPALLSVGASGEIIFRDRHHRITRDSSVTSQGTWRNVGKLEPVMGTGFTYDEAWRNIVNAGSVNVDTRQAQPVDVVWSSEETISLTAGETKVIIIATTDPFMNAIRPVEGIDFVQPQTGGAPATITVRLLRTSGVSTSIVIKSEDYAAQIVNLQLRGQSVTVRNTVQVSAEDTQSVAEYGTRSYPNDLPWCGVADAQSILTLAVATYSNPRPVVSARFQISENAPTARATAILGSDISDRVRIVETQTVLNDDFHIESIQHELTSELDHSVTFGLELVAMPATPVARTDTVGAGADQGKLGNGLDDPGTIIILDSTVTAHRLDAGACAT